MTVNISGPELKINQYSYCKFKRQKSYSCIKPAPGLGDERMATSPSLNVHFHSFTGRAIASYHPKPIRDIQLINITRTITIPEISYLSRVFKQRIDNIYIYIYREREREKMSV